MLVAVALIKITVITSSGLINRGESSGVIIAEFLLLWANLYSFGMLFNIVTAFKNNKTAAVSCSRLMSTFIV